MDTNLRKARKINCLMRQTLKALFFNRAFSVSLESCILEKKKDIVRQSTSATEHLHFVAFAHISLNILLYTN